MNKIIFPCNNLIFYVTISFFSVKKYPIKLSCYILPLNFIITDALLIYMRAFFSLLLSIVNSILKKRDGERFQVIIKILMAYKITKTVKPRFLNHVFSLNTCMSSSRD